MGFVSQIFGQQSAPIQNAATSAQANATLGTAQQVQQQQQQLQQQLDAQNGIQNQSNVFNSLGQVANGSINPAQNQLNQNTAANTATQASLMAGQRGVGDNAGLIARQASNVGANNQQQAIGQAATMQSTNQLNAMGQQANIAGQQVANQIGNQQNQATNAQNLYGTQTNAINGTNNAQVANTSSQNALTGSIVGGLIGGAGSALTAGAVKKAHGGAITQQDANNQSGAGLQPPPGGFSITQQLKNAKMMKAGGVVPGHAKVAHDSYANDTVNAKLSPGEVVIDKDTMGAKGKVGNAARLLQAYLSKKNGKK